MLSHRSLNIEGINHVPSWSLGDVEIAVVNQRVIGVAKDHNDISGQ